MVRGLSRRARQGRMRCSIYLQEPRQIHQPLRRRNGPRAFLLVGDVLPVRDPGTARGACGILRPGGELSWPACWRSASEWSMSAVDCVRVDVSPAVGPEPDARGATREDQGDFVSGIWRRTAPIKNATARLEGAVTRGRLIPFGRLPGAAVCTQLPSA